MASPPGIRVPDGGSCCSVCKYVAQSRVTCTNPDYVNAAYKIGKRAGDPRFVDGKTGEVIIDSDQFCCNVFDWDALPREKERD